MANDVLEHIPHSNTLSVLLDWSEFLVDGGKLHVQTSSILGVARQLNSSKKFEEHIGWTICLFGNQAHEGDYHHVGFTERTLRVHLLAAGYTIDSFEETDLWLFHVDCRKTENWLDILPATKKLTDQEFVNLIFKECFGRKPDNLAGTHLINELKSKNMSRKDALKHLMSSRERLYYIAQKHKL